jgi:predicted metal-binding protein
MTEKEFIQALGDRSFQQGVIPVPAIVFSDEFAKSCRVCVNYNTRWNCPPAIDPPGVQQKKIKSWQWAFVFSTKHDLTGPFDFEGMFFKALGAHRNLTIEMHEKFGKINPVFGAGSCYLCKQCAWPNEPCRFPEKCVSSIEAAGIDVTALSRCANLSYNNGDRTVTYFSMVLFNDPGRTA